MNIREPKLNGLVLSGGKSRRMGHDKGAISYHGISQREHLYQLLLPLCEEVFISCNKEQASYIQGLPLIEDDIDGAGPIIGILSAFRKAPEIAWLTVACDLPFLTSLTLEFLVKSRSTSKVATAFYNPETGFPEPLITIWEPSARKQLLDFLNRGYSCPRKVLINSDIEMLEAPEIKELQNINYAEEYLTVMGKL